jgi:hypothetical protein
MNENTVTKAQFVARLQAHGAVGSRLVVETLREGIGKKQTEGF